MRVKPSERPDALSDDFGVWVCDFAQINKSFTIVDNDIRIMSPRLTCSYKGVIYSLAKDDAYKYYGGKKNPIGLPIRNNFPTLNYSCIDTSFCFPMNGANEIWFCVPTGTNTAPDTAYVYNWELDNWTITDCAFLSHSLYSGQPSTAQSYVKWFNTYGNEVVWVT